MLIKFSIILVKLEKIWLRTKLELHYFQDGGSSILQQLIQSLMFVTASTRHFFFTIAKLLNIYQPVKVQEIASSPCLVTLETVGVYVSPCLEAHLVAHV